jgi:uncharacterized protein (TIGR00730 family)
MANRLDKTSSGKTNGRLNGHVSPIDVPVTTAAARTPAPMPSKSIPPKSAPQKSGDQKSGQKTAQTSEAKLPAQTAKAKSGPPKVGQSVSAPSARNPPSLTVSQASTVPHPGVIRNICVYCGSGPGVNPAYVGTAQALGKALAAAKIGLVYGGGSLGLMGEVAKSTLHHGGRVTGIIPGFLSNKEQMLKDADELIITDNMHERKMLMFERSDAFVALPGGIGTLEELVEQLTWSQLGRHTKPIIVANIDGFWDPFLALLKHMKSEAFIRPGLELGFVVVDRADQIVPAAINAAAGAHGVSDPALVTRF